MSDEELQVLKELNERQKREEERREAMIESNRRGLKGCLMVFAGLCVLFPATCVVLLSGDETHYPPLEVDTSAVLAEMQGAFESDVTRVELSGHPGQIKIDVYTDFYPDRDVAQRARGMALIAVQSREILSAYPSTEISAYVWPKSEAFYMARASASYTDGVLDGRFDSYVNSVMQ